MTDALLADTDIEEALSGVYVCAIASYAGYAIASRNFDRDGVDLTIEAGSDLDRNSTCNSKRVLSSMTEASKSLISVQSGTTTYFVFLPRFRGYLC